MNVLYHSFPVSSKGGIAHFDASSKCGPMSMGRSHLLGIRFCIREGASSLIRQAILLPINAGELIGIPGYALGPMVPISTFIESKMSTPATSQNPSGLPHPPPRIPSRDPTHQPDDGAAHSPKKRAPPHHPAYDPPIQLHCMHHQHYGIILLTNDEVLVVRKTTNTTR